MPYQETKINELETVVINPNQKNAVILMHGYGANMKDLAGLVNAIDGANNFTWYFPNAPIKLEMGYPYMDSRAWWPIDMMELQRAVNEGRFRDFKKAAPAQFTDSFVTMRQYSHEVIKKHEKLIVGGFSQGAMLASHLAIYLRGDSENKMNEKMQGLICMSGVLIDEQKFDSYAKPSAFPIVQSHGLVDQVLDFRAALDLKNKLISFGLNPEFIEFHGGHEIPRPVTDGISRMLKLVL